MNTDKDCGIERNESKASIWIIVICCVIAAFFVCLSKANEVANFYKRIIADYTPVNTINDTAKLVVNTIEPNLSETSAKQLNPAQRAQTEKMLDPMAFMTLVGTNNVVKVQSALQNHKCSDYRDRDDNEALAYITNKTSVELIDILIENGCDINHKNKYDNTPIMFGVHELNLDKIKVLIEKGADLSATTRSGRTVISLSGNQEIANYLKSLSSANVPDYLTRIWWRGATLSDVKSTITTLQQSDKKGKILTLASANVSDSNIITYLIDNGFDINETDENGVSPIFAAATSNVHPAILIELYNRGANINSQSKEGMTPIMFAIYFKNIGMIKALLDLKANLDIQDNNGLKAIDYARQSNSLEITKILLKEIRENKQ